MSLIRIRGRTILTPILSEEERIEARALRERAIQFQNERQELQRQQHRQCRVYHHQRENQHKTWGHDRCSIGPGYHSSGSEKVSSGCTTDRSTRASPSVTSSKHREGPETSSSSGPSSHGSGGEHTSEGPEDSPSAANVSVQTESSLSLTASTDLRSYLNTSLENSLDTSVSASLDTWQHSPSLAEVDEALLLSGSPEVATNLILGCLHPSSVLHSTAKLQSSGADSQHTETGSTTLVQGQQSVERHTTSECQDTATIASLSLSFASVSEEGGEGSGDGLEVSEEILEVSEDVIDGSEEDRTGSLPSEVESDSHREDDSQRYSAQITLQQTRSPRASIVDVGKGVRDVGLREASSARVREVRDGGLREKRDIGMRDMREASWMSQRDSGRSSSHSDYLDDYLEQLTSRCSSGLGLETPVLSVTTCKSAVPVTTSTASSRVMSTNGTETSNHGSFSSHFGMNVTSKQKEKDIDSSEACHGKSVEKGALNDHKESTQSNRKTEVCQGNNLEKLSTKESRKEKRSPRELHRTRDIFTEPRSSSAASERRVSKKSRARRWSSDLPLDPGRSVGSKYLDSYLGNLTDDAWLQYPTQLSTRRMVFLNSDEYILSVRPQGVKKKQEDSSSTKDHSGSSASEESKKLDTSTASSTDPLPSEEISQIHLCQEPKGLTSIQDSTAEVHPEIPQNISQAPEHNLDLDSQRIQSISSSSKSLQKNEVTDLSLGAQEVRDIILHEAPETPSDKTETKVSSDEGIEVLGSPASTGSDGKLVDDVHGSKSPSEEEVPVVDDETEVIPPSSSQFTKFTTSQDTDSLEAKIPTLKTDESLGCAERNDECLESSSEDSSETEPSTIVYVEDFPIESLNEGQKNSAMDSEGRIKSQMESEEQSSAQMGNKEQSSFQEDYKEQSSFETEEDVITNLGEKDSNVLSKHVMSPHKNNGGTCDEVVGHQPSNSNIHLNETAKQIEEVTESGIKSPVTNTQRTYGNSYDGQRSPESDVYDSEEECLVVQVYDGKSIISHGEVEHRIAKLGREGSAELENGEEVVKIVPQRRDRTKNNIATAHGMELVTERGSEDAMGQVLTLLRAKQQQELEELRIRQEEEVRQFIRQLQCVSPEQLHAFLTASNSSSTSFNGSVKDGRLSVMPQTALKTNIVVRPGVESDDTRGGNKQLRSKIDIESLQEAVVCSDSDVKVTSSARFSLQNVENVELKLSVTPALPSQIREQNSWSGSPSCTSSNPLIVTQSHPSTHLPIMTFSPDTTLSPTTNEKVDVESPKPRPSNHTNLMPSYFMNEEARKSSGHPENDGYMQHDLDYQPFSPKNPTEVIHGPHQVSHSEASSSSDGSGKSSDNYSHTRINNLNLDSIDPMSLINGNCINYGDGMQYYRLCTPDEDITFSKTVPQTTSVESHYQSNPVETVTQPGLFKLLNSGPRPTSITNLLAEHPEMFREDTLEVNMECSGGWETSEAGVREHSRSIGDDLSMAHQVSTTAEGGLDMVPERESAASVCFHRLGQNMIFVKGITRLQACIRRYMTQRLLRTKFIQEQLATLAEIAKLAQQFHRDILTDNIHKGDVDFHKALYNQEGLARERIRRVFVILTIQEQMAFIGRDRQLWQMEQERQKSITFRPSPTHTSSSRNKNRNIEDRPRSAVATKTSEKRPSPTGPRIQQDTKARAVSHKGRTSRLVQPSVIHHASPSRTSTSGIHTTHRLSPRVSRLPVQMERSDSHGNHSAPPHYQKPASHVKSSQDNRYGQQPNNRCPSHPRCNSASQLPNRTGSRQGSRTLGHVTSVTRSMNCIARSASHSSSPQRATPTRSTNKTSIVGRRPWR